MEQMNERKKERIARELYTLTYKVICKGREEEARKWAKKIRKKYHHVHFMK